MDKTRSNTAAHPSATQDQCRRGEAGYLALVEEIEHHGSVRMDRTGVGTRALFGRELRFDLAEGFPLLTTKRMAWKTAFIEMLWMIGGGRNIRPLVKQGVSIWTDWPLDHYRLEMDPTITRKAFEARIIEDDAFAKRWGDLGPVYGWQWRRWTGADGREHDQLSDAIERLRTNPADRRIIIEGWNVAELDQMTLPPCHKTYQFHVADGRLTTICMQRSCDIFLGVPFNVANLAFLNHLIAAQTGLEPGEAVWYGCDVHLYSNHHEAAAEQRTRSMRPLPSLTLDNRVESLFEYRMEHVDVTGYDPHPRIRAEVAV